MKRRYRVVVDGRAYEVEVEEIGGGVQASVVSEAPGSQVAGGAVQVQAAPAAVQAAPEPKAASGAAPAAVPRAGVEGGEVIKAPLPGVITEYKVKVGDKVKRGQVLLLLEAMKMQNEIMAPRDGVVLSIDSSQGANVNTGDPLLTLG